MNCSMEYYIITKTGYLDGKKNFVQIWVIPHMPPED
jgi:hypothetical protein